MRLLERFRYFFYRAKWYLAGRGVAFKSPVHLDLELTSRCNLKCPHCPQSESVPFPKSDMKPGVVKQILREAREMGVYSVKFNWRGEPTVYPHLCEVIRYTKYLGFLEIMINTNGFSQNIVPAAWSGLTKIIVSLDSIDYDTYPKIRRGANLSQVIQNMNLIKEGRPDVHLRAQFRLTKINPNEGDNIRREMTKRRRERKYLWWADNVDVRPATRRTAEDYTIEHLPRGRRICPQPFQRILIDSTGKVHPCCGDWFGMLRFNGGRELDIKDYSLSFIWQKQQEWAKNIISTGENYAFEPCKSCFVRETYK